MKDVLKFKNMQDMSNEAEEFLAKVLDPDIKSCAKFLLISCYAYMNEFIGDNTKKNYANLSTLVKFELVETEYDENHHSKLYVMLQNAPDRCVAKKVYNLYYNCEDKLKKYAQMRLMDLLLTYYIK